MRLEAALRILLERQRQLVYAAGHRGQPAGNRRRRGDDAILIGHGASTHKKASRFWRWVDLEWPLPPAEVGDADRRIRRGVLQQQGTSRCAAVPIVRRVPQTPVEGDRFSVAGTECHDTATPFAAAGPAPDLLVRRAAPALFLHDLLNSHAESVRARDDDQGG